MSLRNSGSCSSARTGKLKKKISRKIAIFFIFDRFALNQTNYAMHLALYRAAFNSVRCFNVVLKRSKYLFIAHNHFSSISADDRFDQTPSSSDSSPDSLAISGKHHAAQKARKISKAMEAYMKIMSEKGRETKKLGRIFSLKLFLSAFCR